MGSVYPIPVLTSPKGLSKQGIPLRYIYWARSATLTAKFLHQIFFKIGNFFEEKVLLNYEHAPRVG